MSTIVAVSEKPILMHARSIRGILEGRKTQTRRIIKPQPIPWGGDGFWQWTPSKPSRIDSAHSMEVAFPFKLDEPHEVFFRRCPYGKPGDRLWVRETWGGDDLCGYAYRADHPDWPRFQGDGDQPDGPWRPSIHMPRKASRLTLEITDIKVERVQSIGENDARREGSHTASNHTRTCVNCGQVDDRHVGQARVCFGGHGTCFSNWTYRAGFAQLWDDTNGAGAWTRNDWVWALSFKRIPS